MCNSNIYLLYIVLGVQVIYLPPYSPDLNPIEEAFSQVKSFIRRNASLMSEKGLLFDMYTAMDIVSADDALSYIIHAGYF